MFSNSRVMVRISNGICQKWGKGRDIFKSYSEDRSVGFGRYRHKMNGNVTEREVERAGIR